MLTGLASVSLLAIHAGGIRAQEDAFPLVVDLDWLANESMKADLRVFDVSPLHVWRGGHIDSARHAWWRDTVDPNYPVFGAVLTQGDEQAHRQRVMDSLDLRPGDRVVVYDNEGGFRAARLVWFLRFLGLGQTALLSAGFDDWNADPFPIESASTSSGSPTVDPQQNFYLVTQQVLDRLDDPAIQLADIRTDQERADDLSGNMPTGQIPGSIRLPWKSLLDESGHLRAALDVASLAADAGLDPVKTTVIYGSFGVDTALPWLALSWAGFADLQTYDRGWAEWSITPDLPREPLS
jgi:thiosulfate/3-mercaptopyruvate sulfurtransferase